MKQFNHESGKVEGTASYNFQMGKRDKTDNKIITAEKGILDLSGKRLDQMKSDAGVKTDEEYEKEIQDIKEYNNALLTPDKQLENFKLNGNAIIIRLFKHFTTRKVGNLYLDNTLIMPYQTEGGKIATRENPLQFIARGVINLISDQCTETFRSKFKVGDVVDLKQGLNLFQQKMWLNPEDQTFGIFDNYFLINENMIEKGIINFENIYV